jgi:hypothetical protein
MQENQIERNNNEANQIYDMSGLRLAFWGLIFTAINIRIQGFDIMPDVIGYIMVIIGLGRIEKYEEKFSSAKKIAYVLTVLSLMNIVQVQTRSSWETWGTDSTGTMQTTSSPVTYSAGIFGENPGLAMLFMIVGMLASLYFSYCMCMGMKALLIRVGDYTLAGICDDRWKLILVAEIGLLVSMLTVTLGVPYGLIPAMIFGALALIALVMFILLVHHAYKSIDGKEGTLQ